MRGGRAWHHPSKCLGCRTCLGGIEQIEHGNDGWHELVVGLDWFFDNAEHDIRIVGVRVGAILGPERIGVVCSDVDISLLGPSDPGAVTESGGGAAVVNTWVVVDAALEGREDSDPFVPASSSHETCEVDGLIDVGRRFGVE